MTKPRAEKHPWLARQLRRTIFAIIGLAAWEALSRYGPWPPYLLPGPLEVGATMWDGLANGTIVRGVGVSLRRLLIGFGLSVALGFVIGLLNARFERVRETLGVVVLGLQALPSICWLPLALLWFGLNERAILFVVIMGSLLSVALAAEDSIRQIPAIYLRVARNMGAKGPALYRHVVLPASLPTLVAGLKQGWSFAWRSLMAGELLFVGPGLGQLLMMGRDLNDMSQVIAIMLVIVIIGLVVDRFVFGAVERRLRRQWGPMGLGSA